MGLKLEQSKIEFRKVRDFGALLNVTFDYIRKNFNVLFKSNLLIACPTILLAGVFLGNYQSSLFTFDPDSTLPQIGISFLLYALFSMLSYLIIMVVTYSHLMVYKNTEMSLIDVETVWQGTKSNFGMLLLTMIGYSLILGLIGVLLIGLGFYLTFQGYYFFVFIALFGIGLVTYLLINYSLVFIIRLEESLGFFDALKRSKKLISNNWWFTFGLILVIGLIQSVITYALYIPSYVVMIFTGFAAINNEVGVFAKTLHIITSILVSLGVLLYTTSIIATTFQYYNLV